MNLEDLARIVRTAVGGQSGPALAAVGGGDTPHLELDAEFAEAVRSLSTRAGQAATKPDDPIPWT